LANPYTNGTKPNVVEREGQLLRRIAMGQWLTLGLAGLLGLSLLHSWQLGAKAKGQVMPWVIEVAETGQVRTVGLLPQQPYEMPGNPALIFVIKHWLWHLRTVGDSKVLLGQNWETALAFTADPLQAWVREQIAERYQQFQKHRTIQITQPMVLPLAVAGRVFKATWEEVTYGQSGDVLRRGKWEATFTLRVKPPPSIQDALDWKNDLGILVSEVHWLELTTRGPQS
jgi:type IV secretory pathway TrbF-like protein